MSTAPIDETVAPAASAPASATPNGDAHAPGPMTQRRVLRLALPIIGENMLQTTVGLVDTLFVARLGASAVAGVGVALEVVFFMIAILSSVAIGGTILVSQAIGAGKQAEADANARQTVLWGAIIAMPLSLIGFIGSPWLIAMFHTAPDVAAHATVYLRITTATSLALLMTFVCGAVLRGAGDSQSPLRASLIANLVNIVLAWALIFGHLGLPKLGVAGSAWGTAIARAIGAGILLWILLSGKRAVSIRGRAGWRPHPGIARKLMRLGVPSAVEQVLMESGFTVFIAIVALIGTAALAAQQISFTALSIAFLPGFGFATAATALVGQSIGAGRPEDARFAAKVSTWWSLAWMSAGALLYFLFAESIIAAFTSDADVVRQGAGALRALALSLPLWAFWTVKGGSLRGTGDTRTPMLTSTVTMWSAVLLAWIWVEHFNGNLTAVWLTFLITGPIAAFGNEFFFHRRMRRVVRERAVGAAI